MLKMIGKKKDHTGRRFGMLTASALSSNSKRGGARWLCKCDCGAERVIPADILVKGRVNSCGCSSNLFRSKKLTRHGHASRHTFSPTYMSWTAMRARCERKTSKFFADYGGRGITVCVRWEKFDNFLADMGERPTGKTLDRKNYNGNYNKENCRWSTRKEQSSNQRLKVRNSDVADLIRLAELVIEEASNINLFLLSVAIKKFKSRKRTP